MGKKLKLSSREKKIEKLKGIERKTPKYTFQGHLKKYHWGFVGKIGEPFFSVIYTEIILNLKDFF